MNDNDEVSFSPSPLAQARNRWTGAIRQLMLGLDPAVLHPVGDGEPTFMSGGPLGFDQLAVIGAWMRAMGIVDRAEQDLLYVEFGDHADADEPRAIHVVLHRSGLLMLRRDCKLWLDRDGRAAALMSPHHQGGHFVNEDNELVNVPGQPAKAMAPGYARARARLRSLAACMSDEEARLCFEPMAKAA